MFVEDDFNVEGVSMRKVGPKAARPQHNKKKMYIYNDALNKLPTLSKRRRS